MTSLSNDNQVDIIEAFKSTSRYLDKLLDNDNPYFEGKVSHIYPPNLQLNKANTSDTDVPFLDLHLSISYGFVSSKIYDKRNDFDFDIVRGLLFKFVDFPHCRFNTAFIQYQRQYYKEVKSPCFKNESFLKKFGEFCIKMVSIAT